MNTPDSPGPARPLTAAAIDLLRHYVAERDAAAAEGKFVAESTAAVGIGMVVTPAILDAAADGLVERSVLARPECYRYMGAEEYADCVEVMLDDLKQLAQRDGCIAAAWALVVLGPHRERLT